MTLEEAIIHAEDVTEINQSIADNTEHDNWMDIVQCKKYAEEHRQLADWLKELKRARTLLKATHELLMKQNDSGYVLNLLGETIFYDESECDGCCLMNDIEDLLEYGV